MRLSALIAAIGDDNVRFQNLDQNAVSLDWSLKRGGRISFGTNEEIIPGEGTKHLGLVLWLDREAVSAALSGETENAPKRPPPTYAGGATDE